MAQRYIGLNRGHTGAQSSDFTIGTSTGSTDVEVRIDTTKSLTRNNVKLILEAIVRVVEAEGGVDGLFLDDFGATV